MAKLPGYLDLTNLQFQREMRFCPDLSDPGEIRLRVDTGETIHAHLPLTLSPLQADLLAALDRLQIAYGNPIKINYVELLDAAVAFGQANPTTPFSTPLPLVLDPQQTELLQALEQLRLAFHGPVGVQELLEAALLLGQNNP